MAIPGLIFEAIPRVMAKVGPIAKERRNTQGSGYQFRGIDDVYNALQPILAEEKLFFAPLIESHTREERQSKSGGHLIYTIIKARFVVYASDGSCIEACTIGEAMDSGDKSANKAMSAALKYALIQLFCIATDDPNNDSDSESHEVLPATRQKTTQVTDERRAPSHTPGSAPSPGDFVIRFGKKLNGKRLKDIPERDIRSYGNWLTDKLREENRDPGPEEDAFLKAARAYLGTKEAISA